MGNSQGLNDNWGGSNSSSNWNDWDNDGADNGASGAEDGELVVELIGNSEYCNQRFVLKQGTNTIGRLRDCDCIVDFGGVSRHHATIEVGADGLVTIMDNGSGNGTSLGGQRIEPLKRYPLQDGDTILISKPSFLLSIKRVSQAQKESGAYVPPDKVDHGNSPSAVRRLSAPTMVGNALVPVEDGANDIDVGMDIEFDDELPPAPPPAASGNGNTAELEAKLAKVEQERQQLARLFEMAVRYLTRDAGETTSSILFKVLDELVDFDCAFTACPTPEGKMRFSVHQKGNALVKENKAYVARFAREGDGKHTVVFDGSDDAVAMNGLTCASRAIIPFGHGGRLILLSKKAGIYAVQVQFLDLIGRLHTCIE